MALRLAIAGVLGALAVVIAVIAQHASKRATHDAGPVAVRSEAPLQLRREDFARPDAPWLVVLFSSANCDGCRAMAAKVEVLESGEVATCEIEYTANKELHRRYAIDAVPLVVVADSAGVTRRHFFGATSATDVWAALAELRGDAASETQST